MEYINYDGFGTPPAKIYGVNYPRLCELKTRYDPQNVFGKRFGLEPASATKKSSEELGWSGGADVASVSSTSSARSSRPVTPLLDSVQAVGGKLGVVQTEVVPVEQDS